MAMGGGSGNSRIRGRYSRAPMSEINVTPMVDVMLVLLIIFMITAPMMTAGVNVDLPKTAAKPLSGQDERLTVNVTSAGNIYLNEEKVEIKLGDLAPKLAAIAGENKEIRIVVRGDKTVDYGRIMQAVGEINAAGFTKVSLVTETGGAKK